MANDPEIRLHKEWLGFLQPVGLVVSPPALSAAQAVVNRNVVELQQTLATVARREPLTSDIGKETFGIDDFPAFTINVLGWQAEDLVVSPEELAIALPDYNEVLIPTYAVPDPNGGWMMLVQVLLDGTELDNAGVEDSKSTAPFLEGRPQYTKYQTGESLEPPRVSDGVIHKVLQGLLILDGERLSYRSLAVEQIGSVYEAIMGYEVERASSPAIGVWSKPKGSKSSVTVVISVEEVLKTKVGERVKYLKDVAGCEITGKSLLI